MNNFITHIKALKDKGFFHLIVSNYSIQIVVFIAHILIAKIMLPKYVGIIKTIEIFISIAIVLGSGGMIFAILKLIPLYRNKKERQFIFIFSLKYIIVFSFIVFLLFNGLTYIGIISKNDELLLWFKWYSIIIIPSVVFQFLIRFYQSIDEFKRISILIFYFKTISMMIILSLTYFLFIKGYVISMVITTSITALYLIIDLRKRIILNNHVVFDSLRSRLLKLSRTAFIAQLIDQLKLHVGFLIANFIILDRYMFGQYSFALIIVQGLNILSSSVQQFITPKLSSTSNDIPVFFNKLKVFEKRYYLVTIIIFCFSFLVFPKIILLIFGNKYLDSIPLLKILLVGWLINSFFTLKGVIFICLGEMQFISYTSLIILVLIFPLSYYFNIMFNVYGSAYTFVFQSIISGVVLYLFSKKIQKKLMNEVYR